MLTVDQLLAIKAHMTVKDTRAKVIHVYNNAGTILLATYKTVNAFQIASGLNGSDIKKIANDNTLL